MISPVLLDLVECISNLPNSKAQHQSNIRCMEYGHRSWSIQTGRDSSRKTNGGMDLLLS